ncbi:type II secretion system F family protein [Zavarzinia sp.]|uniref:type II secretion system F family protein n=1 Tax=Zavarzinia sp. TaxID=2027920 RepID=UPI00356935ED
MPYTLSTTLEIVGALLLLFIGGNVLVEEARRIGETRRLRARLTDFSRHDSLIEDEESQGGFFETVGRATTHSPATIAEFERIMRSTGRYDPGAPYWLAGMRLIGGIVLGVIGLAAGYVLRTPNDALIAALVGFALGYFGPRYYMSTIAKARRKRMERELPFLIDMLLLLVRSGASIEQSFRHLTQEEADGLGTIKTTIDRLVADIDQGKGYEVSLQRWGARLAIDEGREFSALLIQSLAYGTELTAALKVFSETLIERRMNGARAAIGMKMTQLTVVMMIFMLPPLLIVIAGPAVSRLIEGLSRVGGG